MSWSLARWLAVVVWTGVLAACSSNRPGLAGPARRSRRLRVRTA